MTRPDATPFVSRLADRAVSVVCPPKLNLTLAVGKPRADGLHPIASLMVGLGPGFADTLTLEQVDAGPSTFDICFSPDAPIPGDVDWPANSDLVYRAHALMEKETGGALPVRCALSKRIPVGAGLGGGSADAAGMLVGLRTLFDLDINDQRLAEIGGKLGSDISFCVHAALGRRVAWVEGVGELITPLAIDPRLYAVLLLSDVKCPTAEIYRRFDQRSVGQFRTVMPDQPGICSNSLVGVTPYNDLAEAAMGHAPVMQAIQEHAQAIGATAHVSGSGSAMFILCPNLVDAERVANQIETSLASAIAVSS